MIINIRLSPGSKITVCGDTICCVMGGPPQPVVQAVNVTNYIQNIYNQPARPQKVRKVVTVTKYLW